MAYKVSLLVRQIDWDSNPKHPTAHLFANLIVSGENVWSDSAEVDVKKGFGSPAIIATTEHAFIRFILHNYGPGNYTIQNASRRFKTFWSGKIEIDRFIRNKGSIGPYIRSARPRQWHILTKPNQEE